MQVTVRDERQTGEVTPFGNLTLGTIFSLGGEVYWKTNSNTALKLTGDMAGNFETRGTWTPCTPLPDLHLDMVLRRKT